MLNVYHGDANVFEDFLQVCEVGRESLFQRQTFEAVLEPQSLSVFQPQVLIPKETLMNRRPVDQIEIVYY